MSRLPLKYVHRFRDRHGHLRHYFRRKSQRIALPGLVGSEEFMAAYQAALTGEPLPAKPEIGASRTVPGTVGALVVNYYKSSEWIGLEADTQRVRKPHIERFREQHGTKRLALLQRGHIERIMASIPNIYSRRHWLQAIRALLQSAVPLLLRVNPTEGAKVKVPKSRGHHTWTDEEIAQYRAHWPLGTQQRLVMEFALETVSRRAEVVRLGPQHIQNGRIRIDRVHGSKPVDIPVTPELQAACDAMPKEHALYVLNPQGQPRTPNSLGKVFRRWTIEAGLPANCRLHGLKKGGMRRLAESELTGHQIMAISGHHKLAMVEIYTEDANRKKLANSGMAKRIANSEWQPDAAEVANSSKNPSKISK